MPEYYPPVGFHFRVEIDLPELANNDTEMRFQEVSGLEAKIGVYEHAEGGENRFKHQLPDRAGTSRLTLKRGMLVSSKLIKWFHDSLESFQFRPTTARVTLLNEKSEPLTSWMFYNVWPVRMAASDLNAKENAIVVDTIELAYSYYKRS